MINKELVKKRFSNSLRTYTEAAVVQKSMAKTLAELIPHKNYDSILEIGCGTGFVTEILVETLKFRCYDTVDMVGGCEKFIKNICADINFINADIENYLPDKKYDLVISNAALQWLEDFESFLKLMRNFIKPDGIFAFTVFGRNNFRELNFCAGLRYYSIFELKSILKNYKIVKIFEDEIILHFNSPKEALLHIKNTGANSIRSCRWTKSDLEDFERDYQKVCKEDGIQLTYNPIYAVLAAV